MDGDQQRKTCACPQTGDCYDSVPPGQEPPAGEDDQAVEAFAEDHAPGSDCAEGQYCGFPNGTSASQILCPSNGRCPGEGSPSFPQCTPGEADACACEQEMDGEQQALTCACPQTGDCYDAVPPGSSDAGGSSTTNVSSADGNSSDAGVDEDLSPGHHCEAEQFCGFPNHTSVSQILCPSTNRCPGEGAPSFPQCTPGEADACACEQEMDGDQQRKTCACPQTGDCYDSVPPGMEPPAGEDDQAVEAFAEDHAPGSDCAEGQYCGFPNGTSASQILCPSNGRCPGEGSPSFPQCTPGEADACACEQEMDGEQQALTCACPQTGDCYDAVPPGSSDAGGSSTTNVSSADGNSSDAGVDEDLSPGHHCEAEQFCGFPNHTSVSQILCPSTNRCPGEGAPSFPQCTPGEADACACEQEMDGDQQRKTCACPQTGDCYDSVPPGMEPPAGEDDQAVEAFAEDHAPGSDCSQGQYCGFPDSTSSSQILCPSSGRCPGEGSPSFPTCTPGMQNACACQQVMDGEQQALTCECPQSGDCYDALPPGDSSTGAPSGDGDDAAGAGTDEDCKDVSGEYAGQGMDEIVKIEQSGCDLVVELGPFRNTGSVEGSTVQVQTFEGTGAVKENGDIEFSDGGYWQRQGPLAEA
ncbi:unnamed protein product [Prorocentrum cordatum]|uniref:Uncharacterized protein n=1 Tax=Prorocentrum cordatum TaxID=2364126 RepID=A0ABN9U5C8_9DINO|nr:unnamed protein product [Polarella glacialis]